MIFKETNEYVYKNIVLDQYWLKHVHAGFLWRSEHAEYELIGSLKKVRKSEVLLEIGKDEEIFGELLIKVQPG